MTQVLSAKEKAANGLRLSFAEAMELYETADFLELAGWARAAKERKSGKNVYYNVNRHINLTNLCVSGCPLCAFARGIDDRQTFALSVDDVEKLLKETASKTDRLTEVHMVSALHPARDFSYYIDVVKKVKEILPHVHLKAFTPVEIIHFSKISGKSIEEVLTILKDAGLDSLPGGGAEILDDEIRRVICPNKATASQWIETMKTAHRLGIPTNATILYGHIESKKQRIAHLFTLRDIQDETGGFQAFAAFPFHPANTKLRHLKRLSSWEDLRFIAIARLILDNIDHIKAFWMMLTLPVAQLSLAFGADDLDGTVEEEKIIHAAGAVTANKIAREEIVRIVEETGYIPVERNTFYQAVDQ